VFFLDCSAEREKLWSLSINMNNSYDSIERLIDEKTIKKHLKKPLIDTLCVDADIPFSEHELAYYMDFKQGMTVAAEHIKKLVYCLSQKNKFATIAFLLERSDQKNNLTVTLRSYWTVGRIKIEGALFNKESYKRYYLMSEGALFDAVRHEASCKYIQDMCCAQGYLNVTCSAQCTYQHATKTVDVTLVINPGKKFVIESVDVIGNLTGTIEQEMRTKVRKLCGKYYSKKTCDDVHAELKKNLLERGYYDARFKVCEDIDYSRNVIKLSYDFTLASCMQLNFDGNTFFSTYDLRKFIFEKWSLSDASPEVLIADVQELYKEEGFFDVEIHQKNQADSLLFVIQEHAPIIINKIKICGTESVCPLFIKDFFKPVLHERFAQKKMDDIKKTICDWYHKEGYWQADVSWQLPARDNLGDYTLTLIIEEGPRFFLPDNTPAPLQKLIVQQKKHVQALQRTGCSYATCELEYDIVDVNAVFVTLKTAHEYPVRYGKTITLGNNYFLSNRLREQLSITEGDVWDRGILEKNIKKLKLHPIFERITITPVRRDTAGPVKDVLLAYTVDEGHEIKARLGAQWVGRHLHIHRVTPKAGFSYLWKNPSSSGDCLRCDIDITQYYRDVSMRYTLPWITGWPHRSDIYGYSMRYDQPFHIGTPAILYKSEQDGFLLGFNHVYSAGDCALNIGVEWQGIKNLSRLLAEKIQFSPSLIGKMVPYFFIEPTFVIDRLDDKIKPNNGFFSLFTCKGMLPVGKIRDAYFIKLLLEHAFFFEIAHEIVAGFRVRVGHIFNECFFTITPPQRFFLGGAYSMRAYLADLVPPLNIYTDNAGCECIVPIGGKSMININNEIRFPLYSSLYGVLFTDIGMLAQEKMSEIQPKNILGCTGFGVRLYTPVGPLRADIAWKWKKSFPSDCSYAWFITLGNAF
jgi:outer membrane protein assembly factor BamA